VRIATWNVNSVRARLPRLLDWLGRSAPDVVCLQETKTEDAGFPFDELDWAGYRAAHASAGRWNGVAVLSKVGLEDVAVGFPADLEGGWPDGVTADGGRLIAATAAGVRILSVYVPNGREVAADHYRYKLAWLDRLGELAARELRASPDLVVAGDFNVAPADTDVYDPAAFVGATHVTRPERDAIRALNGLGLRDVLRERWPDRAVYSYWAYRAGMFHKNLGMRIDLVLASDPVAGRARAAFVDRQARKGSQPSDHAPVVVDLDETRDDPLLPMIPMPTAGRAG
jgi:exodeoxyribonuclease-3